MPKIFLIENLLYYFADFAVEAVIQYDETTTPLRGILHSNRFDKEVGHIMLEGQALLFICQSKDVAELNDGATLMIENKRYQIFKQEHDGTGLSTLHLELAT